MTTEEPSLEGWAPEVGREASLEEVIDRAFDYRGDVTVVKADGTEVVGYLFNRDAEAPEPYVQLFASRDGAPVRLAYREIGAVRFTGKDMAAGQSYEAYKRRKEEEKARKAAEG